MTGDWDDSRLLPTLIHDQYAVARTLLRPLLDGKQVILSVDDTGLFKKRRDIKPLLIITPLHIARVREVLWLVSFPPYGSEILRIPKDLKVTRLARTGLNFSMAKALRDALLGMVIGDVKWHVKSAK